MEGLTKASAQQPGILTLGCGIRGPGSKGIGDMVGLVHVVTLAWLGKVVIHIMCASPSGLFWAFPSMRTIAELDC